jgi:hypothetical protein
VLSALFVGARGKEQWRDEATRQRGAIYFPASEEGPVDGPLHGRDARRDEAQDRLYGKARAEVRDRLAKALADLGGQDRLRRLEL